jgi:hypothetical protein
MGKETTDFWVYPEDDGPIGVATIPAERLVHFATFGTQARARGRRMLHLRTR